MTAATTLTFKAYSEKSKAKRALVQVFKAEADKVDAYLTQEGGKHGFYLHEDGTPSPKVQQDVSETLGEAAQAVVKAAQTQDTSEEDTNLEQSPETGVFPHDEHNEPEQEEEEPAATSPSPSAFAAFALGQLTADSNKAPVAETQRAPASTTGLKIEKDRPMQNGVKRPSAGGMCRAVWDALDAYREANGGQIMSAAQVKDLAESKGWNTNNASIEFYQWRKFNGIKGRQAAKA